MNAEVEMLVCKRLEFVVVPLDGRVADLVANLGIDGLAESGGDGR